MRLPFAVVTVMCVLASSAPASAQDRLIVGGREVGAIGRFGQTLGPADPLLTRPLVAGGRYALDIHAAVDLRTGARTPLPDGLAIADPVRPRVFVLRSEGIRTVALPDGSSRLVVAAGATQPSLCSYAFSADVLFCVWTRGDDRLDLVAVSPSTGATHLLLAAATSALWLPSLSATPDGGTVYYVDLAPGVFGPAYLKAFDVASGTSTPIPGYTGRILWDDAHERVITTSAQYAQVTTREGRFLGAAFIGGRCHDLAVSAHTGRLYLARVDYYYGPAWETVSVYDGSTYRALAPEVVTPSSSTCPELAVLTAPGAPRALTAQVSPSLLSLHWTNVGAASGFVLEVGFAPGRTDVSVFVGSSPNVAFAAVPPGIYYVRVRGGNEFGGGRPSDEIRVVVP